ncbi:ABC transporter permease [Clostridium sp. DJ247]|uniref:ABC transporter permease n=1 Tax=Clostridium sp. DJ247 TaxID=2726188 RepID=UPI001627ACE6|nr:ABC transporter permease [Clostridium sp. DJ247]MBC2581443.1 ABC transporter permease [Clostridium sp. DJ247]
MSMMIKEIRPVIVMSLIVSISSTVISSLVGIILGILAGLADFKMKKLLSRLLETFMSTPPVLMGLIVYLILSRKGILGGLELLFTSTAMIIAQTLLVFPIIAGLTMSSVQKQGREIKKNCEVLGASKTKIVLTIISEMKGQLLTIIATGFGRAISEVGAVMMVGGNIKEHTRVMTTYIALETGKGNFEGAITIGVILLVISLTINITLHKFQGSDTNEY